MNPAFTSLTEGEFRAWLSRYPRQLEKTTVAVVEPPLVCFLDHALESDAPDGSPERFFSQVVAKICCNWMGPDGQLATDHRFYEYCVREGQP